MIEVKNLVKRFEKHYALNGLSMSVEKGTIYGLIGPNGAGKTTLMKHISGVLKPDSGEVLIDGEPVWENTRQKGRLVCIPDELYFFPKAGIRDMMKYYRGIYPNFSTERYEKLKEIFALDEKAQIRKFSKGMQKQASFWIAMSCCPDILLLDEPVDGLDPVMRRQVWSIILSDVAERQTTVLISSHNLRELEDVCDHVGIIDKGSLLLQRSLSELQGNIVKVQAVFENGEPQIPDELKLLHSSCTGRIHTLIIKGEPEYIKNTLSAHAPLLLDILPLTLEEIFVYELGGLDYAVKDIIL